MCNLERTIPGWWRRVQTAETVMSAPERSVTRRLLFGFGCLYASGVASCVLGRMGNCAELTATEQGSALLAVALTVLPLWSGLLAQKLLPAILNPWRRLVAGGLPGLISLAALCVLARLGFDTVSQLLVAVCWAVVPMGVCGGLMCGLEEAAYRRRVTPDGSAGRS
jgi:hypothetical protein